MTLETPKGRARMTQDTTPEEYYQGLDDADLLDALQNSKATVDEFQGRVGRVEFEIRKRLVAQGATEMVSHNFVARLMPETPRYDPGIMAGLRELVSEADWAKALIPEKVTVTPAKLDMTKAKPWLRRGKEIAAVFDRARLPSGPGTLKITRKEEK